MTEQVSLYFKEGTSDKEYHIWIRQADSGWVFGTRYGRRGSSMTADERDGLSYDEAKKLYDQKVKKQKAKGYTEGVAGTPYQGTEHAGRVSGLMPQLLNAIDEDQMVALLNDNNDRWMAQEKKDGIRLMVRKSGDHIIASNRKGLIVPLSQVIETRLQQLDIGQCVLDGEAIGDVYWVFDALEMEGNDLREEAFDYRYEHLINLCECEDLTDGAVRMVFAAYTVDERHQLFEQIKAANGEGIVFKHADSIYRPGRPASGGNQLKFKFKASATVYVEGQNPGKRSVMISAGYGSYNARVGVGNVTIPPNYEVPETGTCVEVEYLYAFPQGSLFQPVYKGLRVDKTQPDHESTLKYKQTTTDEDET